ncbi:MAG: MFS transporter [Sinobacteraceae bacterium]|nr:MFS transporter [Nevskiaceae bacterium]
MRGSSIESLTATPSIRTATPIIVGCLLVALCEGFDLQAAGVAAGGIAKEFGPTPDQLGTFFSASTLGLFAGALVGGRLSDSFGRVRVLLLSVILFGAFSVFTATAQNVAALSWGRLLTGAGLGGAFPNILALVNETSSPGRRNANVALAYGGMPFGGAVASLLAMLITPGEWRLIFLCGGVAPLLLAPLLWWALRAANPAGPEARLGVSLQQPGAVSAAAPGSFLEIFAHGRALPTVLLWVSSFVELLTLYLLLSWLPTLLMGSGFSNHQAAGVQIMLNLGAAGATWLLGQSLDGRGRNAGITAAFVSGPVFVLLLSMPLAGLSLVVFSALGLGASVVSAQGFIYATAPRCYPRMIRGMGVGAVIAMGRLGSIVGPKLGGALKAAGHSASQLLLDILPLLVVGSVTALLLAWRTSRWRDE